MNIKVFLRLLFCSGVIIFISSCGKETIESFSPSYNYFPVAKGTFVVYNVDSIYHAENDNNNDDSVYYYHFQVKERIDSTFLDGANRTTQVIVRYRRYSDTAEWTISDVWTQNLSLVSAYRTENNIAFHKLAFPINGNITWNGNDANSYEEELYTYEYLHQPGMYNNLAFDSTLAVLQIDENNYVEHLYGQEVYAAGVGLIYKERKELGKKNGIVVKGMDLTMRVVDYGIE
jgi:hypothetical protein